MSQDDLDALLDDALDDLDVQEEKNEKDRQVAAEELMRQEANIGQQQPTGGASAPGLPPGMPPSAAGGGSNGGQNEAEMMNNLMQAFAGLSGAGGGPGGPGGGGGGAGLHEMLVNTIKQLEDGATDDEKGELDKCKELVDQLGKLESEEKKGSDGTTSTQGETTSSSSTTNSSSNQQQPPPEPTKEELEMFEKFLSSLPKPEGGIPPFPGADGAAPPNPEALKEILDKLEEDRKKMEAEAKEKGVDLPQGGGDQQKDDAAESAAKQAEETIRALEELQRVAQEAMNAQQQNKEASGKDSAENDTSSSSTTTANTTGGVLDGNKSIEELSPEEVDALASKIREELTPEQQELLETISQMLAPPGGGDNEGADELSDEEKAEKLRECLAKLGQGAGAEGQGGGQK